MVSAWIGTTFEVVEADFTIQVVIRALNARAALEQAYDMRLSHPGRQSAEPELTGARISLGPLGDPLGWFALITPPPFRRSPRPGPNPQAVVIAKKSGVFHGK
jgi:hypothetical protein